MSDKLQFVDFLTPGRIENAVDDKLKFVGQRAKVK